MSNWEQVIQILGNLRLGQADLQRRLGFLEANVDNLDDEDLWERLTTYHYGGTAAITDHFRGSTLDATWGWAGAPFSVPGNVAVADSLVETRNNVGNRSFLQVAAAPAAITWAHVALRSANVGVAVGLRCDDGTDNNYVEVVLRISQATPCQWQEQIRWRIGGGAVNSANGDALNDPHLYVVEMSLSGTLWTNWDGVARLRHWCGPGRMVKAQGPVGLGWTPTRTGLIFDWTLAGSVWDTLYVDWCDLA